jgi:hypothetical protein
MEVVLILSGRGQTAGAIARVGISLLFFLAFLSKSVFKNRSMLK